jgi:predicted ABC-type ATPase
MTTFYYNKIKPFHDELGLVVPFVNADELEKDNNPHEVGQHSYSAARQAARLRTQYFKEKRSFVTETVFSHQSKIDLIGEAQKHGFEVVLNHVHVTNPEIAYSRVRTRIDVGGHPVPKKKVEERFPRTLNNIKQAVTKADRTYVWDNNRAATKQQAMHAFVFSMRHGHIIKLASNIPEWAIDVYGDHISKYQNRISKITDYAIASLTTDSSDQNKKAIRNLLISESIAPREVERVFAYFGGSRLTIVK